MAPVREQRESENARRERQQASGSSGRKDAQEDAAAELKHGFGAEAIFTKCLWYRYC